MFPSKINKTVSNLKVSDEDFEDLPNKEFKKIMIKLFKDSGKERQTFKEYKTNEI